MFEQVIAENTARTRRPFTVALSFSGQLLLAGVAILLPVLHTDAIQSNRMLRIVSAPRPIGDAPVRRQVPSSQTARTNNSPRPVFLTPAVQEPSRVPSVILISSSEPPSGQSYGIPGTSLAGDPNGVPGVPGGGVLDPPVIAAPKTVPLTPAATRPMRVGGVVQAAKLINQMKPAYPPLARQARISGVVRLEAIIGRNGAIQSLQVMSGHPLLVDAALTAVKQWSYRPTLLNGEAVEVLTQIEVRFTLGE